jgi:ketosteroid isomerase-like protein
MRIGLACVEDELLQSFRRIYSAIQRGDADELAGNLSHDVEWVLPATVPWGGTHHGPLGIVSFVEAYREHVEGVWADVDEFLDADDRVVAVGRMLGHGRETGKEFEVEFAHVWTITDGVPSAMRAYYDTAPIAAVLSP